MGSAGGDWEDMYNAAERGDANVVYAQLGLGAQVDYQHPQTTMPALVIACLNGHIEVVRVLLEHGADPNLSSERGAISPLQAAREGEHRTIEGLLLQYGADAAQQRPQSWWSRWLPDSL